MTENKELIRKKIYEDPINTVTWLDSLIANDPIIFPIEEKEYLLYSSELYYNLEMYSMSLDQAIKARKISKEPKVLSYESRCYLKLGHNEYALQKLQEAADINYDYYWLLGNYYEILNDTAKAFEYYLLVYRKDTNCYWRAGERVNQVQMGSQLLDSLDFSFFRFDKKGLLYEK